MSPRSYWTYLDWLVKVVVVEPGASQPGREPAEGAGTQGHVPAGWVHRRPGGVAETGQVRVVLCSAPVEHSALVIVASY